MQAQPYSIIEKSPKQQALIQLFNMKYLLLFAILLISCTPATHEEVVIDRPTATQTAIVESQPVPTNTPTPTILLPATETSIPQPTSIPYLTITDPSLVQIKKHLSNLPDEAVAHFASNLLSKQADIFYQDLNGDNLPDLVLSDINDPFSWGQGALMILLASPEGYLPPFVINTWAKYRLKQRVAFADWTGDSIPELIFDTRQDIGGTEYYEETTTRYIIQCQVQCATIWQEDIHHEIFATHFHKQMTTTIELTTTPQGELTLETVKQGFSTFPWQVEPTEHQTYLWSGSEFVPTAVSTLTTTYAIEPSGILTASNLSGDVAILASQAHQYAGKPGRACEVQLNGTSIHEPIPCYPDFSTVAWLDVFGNGRQELIAIFQQTYTQQLLIFTADGSQQISNITADVIQADLFGLRLQDIDNDSVLEILAGDRTGTGQNCKIYSGYYPEPTSVCWYYEISYQTNIYDWNGSEFVLQEER